MNRSLLRIPPIRGRSACAEALAYFAAMSVLPDGAHKLHADIAIRRLKAAGVWARIDLAYMHAAHDDQAGRVCIKTPGTGTLTNNNSSTFTADRGFTGNATDMTLTAPYTPALLTQNDGHVAGFGLTTSTDVDGDVNAYRVAGGTRAFLVLRNGTNARGGVGINTGTNAATGANVPFMAVMNRVDSANQSIYINGALDNTAAVASASLDIVEFGILGNPVAGNYSDRQVAFSSVGGALTAVQIADYYTIIRDWLRALGAVA